MLSDKGHIVLLMRLHASVHPPEKTAFFDNVTVRVEKDSLQRSVKAIRHTRLEVEGASFS